VRAQGRFLHLLPPTTLCINTHAHTHTHARARAPTLPPHRKRRVAATISFYCFCLRSCGPKEQSRSNPCRGVRMPKGDGRGRDAAVGEGRDGDAESRRRRWRWARGSTRFGKRRAKGGGKDSPQVDTIAKSHQVQVSRCLHAPRKGTEEWKLVGESKRRRKARERRRERERRRVSP